MHGRYVLPTTRAARVPRTTCTVHGIRYCTWTVWVHMQDEVQFACACRYQDDGAMRQPTGKEDRGNRRGPSHAERDYGSRRCRETKTSQSVRQSPVGVCLRAPPSGAHLPVWTDHVEAGAGPEQEQAQMQVQIGGCRGCRWVTDREIG